MPYQVVVADNFHYMDRDEEYVAGIFETAEAALSKARSIVDSSLTDVHQPGITAEGLFEAYKMFGDDPYIVALEGAPDVSFSAWDYARYRAAEIIRAKSTSDV